MRLAIVQEADAHNSVSLKARYDETIAEVMAADEAGFYAWGTSEQHFSAPRYSVSAPEVLYAAVARHTERIKLRNMAAILLTYNHPVHVAERMATVDVLSDGRAELTTARSNNMHTIEAFQVPPDSTREQWAESLEIIARAWQDDPFEYDGRFWKIPPRSLVPKPLQQPHPPLSVVATGRDTPVIAAKKGLGMLNWDNYMGWDYTEQQIRDYKEHIGSADPVGAYVNDEIMYFVATALCAETREEAVRVAQDVSHEYVKMAVELYKRMPPDVPGYAYMRDVVERLDAHCDDMEYLQEHSPTVIVGTPDDFVAALRRLEDMGVDEAVLRIDGFGHEHNMRSIRLIGEAVIPKFEASAPAGASL
jgi:alkanesulfonate monooxygenase SsuD/methylene tetrahydromethanopterin reductase-like flavin-dependent oxidoreductase (luciferase family)